MALVAWYPLNGDLKDYTGNENGLINNGAVVNNSGKIGKCYYFDNTYAYSNLDYSDFGTDFTVAFWYKIDTAFWGNRHLICLANNWGWENLVFTCAATAANQFSFNIGNGNTSSRIITCPYVVGEWQHICFTFKNKNAKIYVNGDFLKSGTYPINPDWTKTQKIGLGGTPAGQENSSTLYLNDVRVYNHCLSIKEVKEISKGLVLHYTMDSVYEENKVYDSSGFGNDGIPTDLEYSIDRKKGLTSTKYNGSTSRILTQKGSFSWFNFDECTISCWMKPTSSPSGYTGGVGVSYDGEASEKTLCLNNHGGKLCVESTRDYNWITYSSDYTLPINEWSHCVITINKDNIIKFYVNGELIKTDTLNFGSITYSNANALFQVGCDLAGGDEYYQGYYDDVRFYTTSLSADNILQLYRETQKIDSKGNLYCSELNEVERRVEYLESDGTQWIDTGIKTSDKISFEISFEDNEIITYDRFFFGAMDNNTSRFYLGYGWSNNNTAFAYGGSINQLDKIGSKKRATIKFDVDKNLYVNGIKKDISTSTFGGVNLNIYLFTRNENGNKGVGTFIKIYYCKIWKNGEIVRDFLPTISTEEGHIGEACLFDTVTNTYFYNQGTGKFITNLDESTTNIDFTNKGIVNTDYIIEGKEQAKIRNDGNIIEVNNLYEN